MTYKYFTIWNKDTCLSVPFAVLPNGEIQIKSSNPKDNEDTCIVLLGNIFHEYSIDYQKVYGKI